MLTGWFDLDPVQRCCCTPNNRAQLVRGTKAGEGDLHEEINLGEAHTRGLVPGAPISPIEDRINTAREQAGFRSSPPAGPGERPVPTFVTAEVDVFQGEPLYAGNILQLTLGESIHEMQLVLFANGFSLAPCDSTAPGSPRTVARAWSPFSLVEKCQVKTMQHSAFWAVFKLTVFRRGGQDRCYYFATTGSDAYKERDRWVQEMVGAIGMVTMSLFPGRAITVQPLPDVAATSSRIMAGYLLQNGMADNVSLLYCELQAYAHGKARLAVYSDEWCVQEVSSVFLADSSTISTRKGDYCTVFGIDNHRFCARTREEKDLWVRAVSNVKVKLMFDAPDPTREELQVFRAAVHERIGEIKTVTPENSAAPLLSRVPRLPPLSPRGDAWDPEPMEDTTSDPPVIQGDDNCSIEDIDEAGGPWTDISPPCTETAYCASPKAMAGDLVAFSTPLAEMPPDTEADHSEVVAVEAQDSPQPVTRVVPKVDTGSARGDHGAHGLAFGPPHLCYAGCLTPADELRTTPGEPPGMAVHAELELPPHIAQRAAARPLARPL
mmetsp:Transcript_53934/g.108306  ORF Transcript_53934/g.108306 Transcript_53934/m.108306 type:complete len:549 (+) Transcript_53934:67-1713(+)